MEVPAFDQDSEDGSKFDLSLALGGTETPCLSAALLCPDSGVEAEGVRSKLDTYLAQLSTEYGSVVSEVVRQLSPVKAHIDRDCLHLELGSASVTQTQAEVSDSSASAFFRLEADLGRLRDLPDPKAHGSHFGPFFDLSRFVITWEMISEGMKPFVDRKTLVKRSGKPIIDHVLEGGDWSARAVGTTDGEMTVLTATVGRDLYYFYLAESLLAQAAFFRTAGIR